MGCLVYKRKKKTKTKKKVEIIAKTLEMVEMSISLLHLYKKEIFLYKISREVFHNAKWPVTLPQFAQVGSSLPLVIAFSFSICASKGVPIYNYSYC